MTNYNGKEINVRELMLDVRESLSKRDLSSRVLKSSVTTPRPPSINSDAAAQLDIADLKFSPEFRTKVDNHYHVNDLLQYHDREFIRNAYRAILKRGPDEAGLRGYLEPLRSGDLNKIDVLARLRYSAEGVQRHSVIEGLRFAALIRRLGRTPVLGYLFQMLIGILRLPSSIRERRRFENYSIVRQQEVADKLNGMAANVRALGGFVDERHKALTQLLEQHQQRILDAHAGLENRLVAEESRSEIHEQNIASQKQLGDELSSRIAQTQTEQSRESERLALVLQQLRTELAAQHARTSSMLEAVKVEMGVAVTSKASDVFRSEAAHMLDTLYVELEDRFRGSRSDLKQNFKVYLPYLEQAAITSDILDIGCGRGEWLELLRERRIQARGIDLNRTMIEQCSALGLDVSSVGALDHLRTLKDESLSAVTSFHVIEHLEFEVMLEMIDQIIRTLKPGGLLVFETPNPENVLVGSCNFYLDPSHRQPLPSQVMRFLLEARGFINIEVVGLHPLPSARIEGDTELVNRFNDIFYGPMDYAIIGRKP
jgi:SAM-dependent methyltransferase/uncharacterized coiled-coil protein SlyX